MLRRSFEHFRELEMRCLVVRLDGAPISFMVFQLLPQSGCVVANHMKADYDVGGASAFMLHVFARELVTAGVHTMNMEQDLGIPGLRIHKERWRPVAMLKKYTVEAAPGCSRRAAATGGQ